MRIVLYLGLVIIFITTFFVLSLGSSLAKQTVTCSKIPSNPDNVNCRLEKYNMDMIVTFLMVLSFIIADAGAVYLMVMTWKVS